MDRRFRQGDHMKTMLGRASRPVATLAFCASLAGTPLAAAPVFTGMAQVDFADPLSVLVNDPSVAPDVTLPNTAPAGTISGWDMDRVWLYYEVGTDTLYVGLQTFGIGGDADGNGLDGNTAPWLIGGVDEPAFAGTESFALMFDLDENGTFDVIAGVDAASDITGLQVALFDPSATLPMLAFGLMLPAHTGAAFGNPNAGAPHVEFTIANFSLLPGNNGSVGPFGVQAFMGSLSDDGIGEDLIPNAMGFPVQICFDADGDGVTTCAGDCDDTNANVSPLIAEDITCDGLDNDCDGAVDDDFVSVRTECGTGACFAEGQTSCVNGVVVDDCMAGLPLGAEDATCDGVDDDCDGVTDDEFLSVRTECGAGACFAEGATHCVAGVVMDDCVAGIPAPDDSLCNNADDDCDGMTDEDFVSTRTECGVGGCFAEGITQCVGGTIVDTCSPGVPAAEDGICDGLDEDCDGMTDEDVVTMRVECGVGACTALGDLTCVNGVPVNACQPGIPAPNDSVCDGIDNDCDGLVDEDYVTTGSTCGVGACAATGQNVCHNGVIIDSCMPGSPQLGDATCDGVDDDCDGADDEDYIGQPTMCGVGACAAAPARPGRTPPATVSTRTATARPTSTTCRPRRPAAPAPVGRPVSSSV